MAVTAKFTVQTRTEYRYGQVKIEMQPDYGTQDAPKNAEWAKATPSGKIEMNIDNPAASDQFTIGREFTVIFEPVAE